MDWLSEKIDSALAWLAASIGAVFSAVTGWLKDFVVWVLDALLTGIASLLVAIPVPSFMSGGLGGLFSALPAPLVYLLVETGMVAGLAVIGAGVLFNLTRKLLTLGQW